MLKENFISFPAADGFPTGPYDLDKLLYESNPDGSFELIIQLGWVYDTYLLHIIAKQTTEWELWHQDSAVVHVDPRKVADNPAFLYAEFSMPCDIPLKINIMHGTLEGRAVNIAFSPAVPDIAFSIAFKLESGPIVSLSDLGWRMMNEHPPNDWPSDEWKDWNTM